MRNRLQANLDKAQEAHKLSHVKMQELATKLLVMQEMQRVIVEQIAKAEALAKELGADAVVVDVHANMPKVTELDVMRVTLAHKIAETFEQVTQKQLDRYNAFVSPVEEVIKENVLDKLDNDDGEDQNAIMEKYADSAKRETSRAFAEDSKDLVAAASFDAVVRELNGVTKESAQYNNVVAELNRNASVARTAGAFFAQANAAKRQAVEEEVRNVSRPSSPGV